MTTTASSKRPEEAAHRNAEEPSSPRDDTGRSSSGSWADRKGGGSTLRAGQNLKNYEVLHRIGGGGMAEVHVARAVLGEGVEKLVALKTVLPEFGPDSRVGSMFINEARVSANLQHPNIAQIFDYGKATGRAYLAMEYVHGRDLLALIRRMRERSRLIPAGFAVAVVSRVAEALEYVHGRRDLDGKPLNLVHRDVSPGNIMVTPQSEVKLVDFGVVAAEGSNLESELLVGKARYLTTEQASGQPPDPAWDLYALGVVLYELLTLNRAYKVGSMAALRRNEVEDVRRPPSHFNPKVPPALAEFVLRATDRDPSRRFESAQAFRIALELAAQEVPAVDVGWVVRTVFGSDLAEEEAAVQARMVEVRDRERRRATGFGGGLRRLVRQVTDSPWLRRHSMAVKGIAAAVVLGIVLGGGLAWRGARTAQALEMTIVSADQQILAGRLVGPGGDQALDLLLDARDRWPDHSGIIGRLQAIADTFQGLGDKAIERGNHAEAALHFQVALQADPERTTVADKLRDLEAHIRRGAHGQMTRRP